MADDKVHASKTQEALERFRQDWLSEVARNKQPVGSTRESDGERPGSRKEGSTIALQPTAASRRKDDYSDDVEPRAYHDLPNKEESLVLGKGDEARDRSAVKAPSSALEHYEHAVEKETQGQLGDSISHYRKAFKLDAGVQEAYKKKYFPPSSSPQSKTTNPNPSNASATVPNPAHHSLHGRSSDLSSTLRQFMEEFSTLRIEAAPPPTSISPQEPCFLAEMPEEILTQILTTLGVGDVAALAQVAQVCKRLAYVVLTEESIWKRVAMGDEVGFSAMLYDFACDIGGSRLGATNQAAQCSVSHETCDEGEELPLMPEERDAALATVSEELLRTSYLKSWRHMFRSRPRIRFNGCYISTVNYTRPGATSTNTLSWGAPVHVVTYFRYLRFFRDGTVISLLTTSEPADVVHHLIRENLHSHHTNTLPSSVMKDALRGRWRLSGPVSSVVDPLTGDREIEGDVHVETEGVVPKYTYKMLLALAHAGKGARNNKLAWKSFWSHNRLTDDWAEFRLKNDRAFYWSRVKSYATGY